MGVQSISKKKGLGGEATGVIDAVIYGRASKDRLRLMRSIGDQIADCRGWCEPLGWRVVDVITDADRSASQWRRKEREGFEEALGLIESGRIQGFVTWEPSRAGRDLAIYVQLRAACQRAGVLYLTQGRVYDFSRSDDSFMMGFEFLRAEADANTMRERQLRTARRNAEKGRPHGRLAYGYRRVYDERTGVLIRQEPDPHTGQIVRDAARDVLAGASTLSELGELIEQRADALTEHAIQQNQPWVASLGPTPSDPAGRATWQHHVRTVAAYRDRYRLSGTDPLGQPPSSQGQRLDHQRAALAARQAQAVAIQSVARRRTREQRIDTGRNLGR